MTGPSTGDDTDSTEHKEIVLPRTCVQCGSLKKLKVRLSDYKDWKAGELIQNAFPYLSEDDRELIITKICNSCYNKNLVDWMFEF